MADEGKKRPVWNKESVRALREHLSLTQNQMAMELGTRQQTISEWERGMYKPRGVSTTVLDIVAERTDFQYNASPENPSETDEGTESGKETPNEKPPNPSSPSTHMSS